MQDRRPRLAMVQDCQAEFGARFAEEVEFALTLPSARSVHFPRDRQNVEAIGIVEGHGKPQDRKLPRAQYPLMLFRRFSRTHRNALFEDSFGADGGKVTSGLGSHDQILVGDDGKRSRHLRFVRFVQFDDRQTGVGMHQSEQAQRIFQGRRDVIRQASLQSS